MTECEKKKKIWNILTAWAELTDLINHLSGVPALSYKLVSLMDLELECQVGWKMFILPYQKYIST